jgi:ERO1-like protein alpha
MHTSVNMHIASNYIDFKANNTYPNHDMYFKGIGSHPERLKNMYFLYAVVLRAINRAESLLRSYEY